MIFEGQYLTYKEYQDLGGQQIGETPFNLLELEARRRIDIKTFNRIKEAIDIPTEVKACEYALINSIQSYQNSISNTASNGNVSSESIDGYSISYVTANQISDIVKSKEKDLDDIIRTYLLGLIVDGEHIMYCGVDK